MRIMDEVEARAIDEGKTVENLWLTLIATNLKLIPTNILIKLAAIRKKLVEIRVKILLVNILS